MKKKLWIVSAEYPYADHETYLAAEAAFHVGGDYQTTFFPLSLGAKRRELPRGARLSHGFCIDRRWRDVLKGLIFAAFSKYFWVELTVYLPQRLRSWRCVKSFVGTTFSTFLVRRQMENYLRAQPDDQQITIYSYWYDIATYAAAMVKARYPEIRVVTRAHRFDIDPTRKACGYFPYKAQLLPLIDRLFPISDQARSFILRYSTVNARRVQVARLGSFAASESNLSTSAAANLGGMVVLSCSDCIPRKRVHLTIEGLAAYCRAYPQEDLRWYHIGGGELLDRMKELAGQHLGALGNAEFEFLGALPNAEVQAVYQRYNPRVFVGTSESEGIPVSFMEALSFDVPILATDVGGVREIVEPRSGVLLAKDFSEHDFVQGMRQVLAKKWPAKAVWLEKYNAAENFAKFGATLANLEFTHAK